MNAKKPLLYLSLIWRKIKPATISGYWVILWSVGEIRNTLVFVIVVFMPYIWRLSTTEKVTFSMSINQRQCQKIVLQYRENM